MHVYNERFNTSISECYQISRFCSGADCTHAGSSYSYNLCTNLLRSTMFFKFFFYHTRAEIIREDRQIVCPHSAHVRAASLVQQQRGELHQEFIGCTQCSHSSFPLITTTPVAVQRVCLSQSVPPTLCGWRLAARLACASGCHLLLGSCLDQALASFPLSTVVLRESQQPTVWG
jgi:hypothetical protein